MRAFSECVRIPHDPRHGGRLSATLGPKEEAAYLLLNLASPSSSVSSKEQSARDGGVWGRLKAKGGVDSTRLAAMPCHARPYITKSLSSAIVLCSIVIHCPCLLKGHARPHFSQSSHQHLFSSSSLSSLRIDSSFAHPLSIAKLQSRSL